MKLVIGAECTSFPQAVNLAEVAGWAAFVPEYWWKRENYLPPPTQKPPGLEASHREFQLGRNQKVIERRNDVAALV